jgi:DNA-binding transcriptional MerR regulator
MSLNDRHVPLNAYLVKTPDSMTGIQHSIKIASKRSGLSPHVIRVWEKLYRVVVLSRTKTNRRLYGEAEIERLRLLGLATEAGHTIKNAVKLTTADLKTLVETELAATAASNKRSHSA